MKSKICIVVLASLIAVSAGSSGMEIPANGGAAGHERVPVLIGFTRVPGPSEQAMVRGQGGLIKHSYHLVPAIAASIPEAAIEALLHNPRVTSIEPDIKVYAVDAELDNSWGVKRIGAGTVHEVGNKGSGVKVAIIDTGIDYNHPDLAGNCVDENGDGIIDGVDFVNEDIDPMDDDGHGTHVAGTVAAEDNNFGVVGVAPQAQLYGLKVLGADGSGDYKDVIAALEWAVDYGMQVINLSLGSSQDPGVIVQAAFESAEAAGIVIVAAAGNSGTPPGSGDRVIYPARYESCIAVAATDQSDSRAKWSSTGDDVELAAPGVSINSTLLGGVYGTGSGTSMACPHVAGTAALILSAYPSWTNAEVRSQLQNTADDLGDPGRDTKYGYGLVNAAAAAGAPQNDPPTVSIMKPNDGSIFESGATILFEGTAGDTEDGDLTASLVWTSDLDMEIGIGGSFSSTLSDGTHKISASVTDFDGATDTDEVIITVTQAGGATAMYVAGIEMFFSERTAGRNTFTKATAAVTIVDTGGNIEGATVYGSWSGATSDTDAGVTDSTGKVTLSSNGVKNPSSGTTFTFTVDNVVKSGLTYDSAANVETVASIIVP